MLIVLPRNAEVVGKGFTECFYPPEVGRGKYLGLGVILLQYFPPVSI